VGFVQLLVDELFADVVLGGDVGDWHAAKGGNCELLTSLPRKQCRDAALGLIGG
jgi:hypothetical protein